LWQSVNKHNAFYKILEEKAFMLHYGDVTQLLEQQRGVERTPVWLMRQARKNLA
jgi:uroporphyrinogen-III decarboxylase